MTFTALIADDPASAPGQGPQRSLFQDPMFLVIAVVILFYLVVLLPMGRRQRKEQAALLAGLKQGAKVLTSSGIVGTVAVAKDGEDEIVIRSEDARLRIKRNTVVQVLGADDAKAGK